MSEMVRRVKVALIKHECDCKEQDLGNAFWESASRAAIEAMWEPTEAMLDADGFYPISKHDARLVWHAMIDEALK